MAEAGYAGVELEIWQGIVAPAGTPPAIVRKLNTELIRAAQSPDVVEKVAAQAVEMTTSTPEDFAKLLAADIERLGKLIRDAGIKAQAGCSRCACGPWQRSSWMPLNASNRRRHEQDRDFHLALNEALRRARIRHRNARRCSPAPTR